MKRIWLVLLSLALIASFSTAAMAVDVKVSGEFYAAGMYLDKTTLVKSVSGVEVATKDVSTAFYYQRLRLNTTFSVAPGLSLITRADIMERQWGAVRGAGAVYDSAGTRTENENIAFDWLYLQYVSPIGIFAVGGMNDYAWGTVFGDASKPSLKVAWTGVFGPVAVGAQLIKETDYSSSAVNGTTVNDYDASGYVAFVKYSFKAGSVGYLFRYNRNATPKPGSNYMIKTYSNLPYAKIKLGPVALEGEINYTFGELDYDAATSDKIDSLYAYIGALADFGMFYAGADFAYVSGQDPNRSRRTGLLAGGTDYNPCLILWNFERSYWVGSLNGNINDGLTSKGINNAWFFMGKAGFRPVDKLDIMASVAYANAVVKPTNAWLNNDYGWEVDLTATYKITNNLSYMLGGGYLFTGKYFKGATESAELQNDYLVVNKLTLTF